MTILYTYDDGNRIPEVEAYIMFLTPQETPIYSGARKRKIYNTLDEWQQETEEHRSDNAAAEGASFGTPSQTVPSRVVNITQIFEKTYQVSSTEQAVSQYGIDNMLMHQQKKKLRAIATDIEHALVRGSLASGTGSAARRLAGMVNFITTNATSVASGTKLTESFFVGMLEMAYDQTDGMPIGGIDEVYTCARLKRVISSYTLGNTLNMNAGDKRLISPKDIIETDFGTVKLFIHRDVPKTTITDATALFVKRENIRIGILENVHILPRAEVAQTGHSTLGVIRGELTLELLGEPHMAQCSGLDTSFVA